MSQNKNLVIINNEKVSQKANSFYCDNIDMKSIPEGLSNKLEVLFIGRKSIVEKLYVFIKDIYPQEIGCGHTIFINLNGIG